MGNGHTTFDAAPSKHAGVLDASAGITAEHATSPTTADALTERSVKTWSAGDYDRIAAGFREEAAAFITRLALWPREGFIGQMVARHMACMPTKSAVPSPLFWGDESVVRERLAGRDWSR